MTYLLDTHYMLWVVADSKKIPGKIKDILANPDNRIVISAVSFWEVSLKYALGKLEITGFTPEALPGICREIGFEICPLSAEEGGSYHQLKATYHKDPFDRMLIWQAIHNRYMLVSANRDIKRYVSAGLNLLVGK